MSKQKMCYITHRIGSINSLRNINKLIEQEKLKLKEIQSQQVQMQPPRKSSIAKRLFEDEDEIEYGDSGGSIDNEDSVKSEEVNPIIEKVEDAPA